MMYPVLSRIALCAACAGMTISGVLTLAHTSNMPLPCGGSNGCERVALDPSSSFLGVPLAVFGLAGYAILAVVAILRLLGVAFNRASFIGLFASLFGTIASAYLTYHSITVIHATCLWCLGSAAMMTLSLACYLAMSKATPEDRKSVRLLTVAPWGLVPILAIGAIAVFARPGKVLPADLSSVDLSKVSLSEVADSSRTFGPSTAQVTVAEFADLMCPACREMHQKLLLFVLHNHGRARLMYHHFPFFQLAGHEQSLYAARLSAQLNDDDFWLFVSKVYGMPTKPTKADLDRLFADCKGKRIRTPKEAEARVATDIEIGARYGVKITPTYILFIGDKPEAKASSIDIKEALTSPDFISIFSAPVLVSNASTPQ